MGITNQTNNTAYGGKRLPAATKIIGRDHILGIIPARGGSKGVPRKNIRNLCGKPLIAYTIEAALASKSLDRVLVSTDCPEIAEAARFWGAEVPFLRPEELARDDTPLEAAINYTLSRLAEEGYQPFALALLYPTQPFRRVRRVDMLLEKLRSGYSSVAAYSTIPQPPMSYLYRDQNDILRKLYDKHCDPAFNQYVQMSGYLHGRLLEKNRGIFDEYAHCISDFRETLDVDELEHFYMAEEIIQHNLYPFDDENYSFHSDIRKSA